MFLYSSPRGAAATRSRAPGQPSFPAMIGHQKVTVDLSGCAMKGAARVRSVPMAYSSRPRATAAAINRRASPA